VHSTVKRWSWLRRMVWILGVLVVLLLLVAGVGMLWIHRAVVAALPVVDGTLQLAGLSAPVTVRRDGHGVPHIEAATVDDLLLAQGYTTAQDRLWQMDGLRRNASGELAEVLGKGLVEHDTAQRVLQFRSVAERIYHSLPDADRHRSERYAAGVNLFIAQNRDRLPAEFRLLHYEPRPWTGVDSVLIGLNMVQSLDTHWDVKLARERIAEHLHNPKLEAELYPVGSWRDQPPSSAVADMTQPHPAPPTESDEDDDRSQARNERPDPKLPNGEDLARLRRSLGLPNCDGCGPGAMLAAGSNNWVIAGQHTASGRPLLSNDMHLGLDGAEHLVHGRLEGAGVSCSRSDAAWTASRVAGHNEHVAWGFTALVRRRAGPVPGEARRQGQLRRPPTGELETAGHESRGDSRAIWRQGCAELDVAVDRSWAAVESAFQERNPANRAALDAL
jgi:penicillin amidase